MIAYKFIYLIVLIFIQDEKYRHYFNRQMLALRAYYSRLFSCLCFPKTTFLFSGISKGQISSNAQRSVLATAIIQEITTSKPPKSFTDLSLRDRILRLNPKINGIEINPQIKNEIFQMFTTGIPLNDKIYSKFRYRLKQASQKCIENQGSVRFTFYPNYLVTNSIFKSMQNQRCSNMLLIGGSGTSKTISTILFIYISSFIHNFYFQAEQNPQSKLEWKDLVNQELIKLPPKCFYFRANTDQDVDYSVDYKLEVINEIYQQTSQLSKQKRKILKSKMKNYKQFQDYIDKIYMKNMHVKVMLDNFQTWADAARQCNYKQAGKSKFQTFGKDSSWCRKFNRLNKYLSQLQSYSKHQILFISSNIIQWQVLSRKGDEHNFHLCGRDNFPSFQFSTVQLLKTELWAKIVFWQQFWLHLQNILISRINQAKVEEIKNIFFQKCALKNKDLKSFVQMSDISAFLRILPQTYLQISQQSTKIQIQNKISTLLYSFINFTIQQSRRRLRNYLEGDRKTYQAKQIKRLYEKAFYLCKEGQNTVELRMHQYKELIGVQEDSFKKRSYNDQVFNYQYCRQTVQLALSSYQIVEILSGVLYPEATKYLNFGNSIKEFKQTYNGPLKGYRAKYYLLKCLTKGADVNFPVSFYNQKWKNQQDKRQKQQFSFNIQAESKFLSLSKELKSNKIETNFKELIEKCNQNPHKFFSAFPMKIIEGEQRIDSMSLIIDFVIARYNKDIKTYEFYTFDLALSQKQEYIAQKRKKAQQLFDALLEKQASPIIINHTICSTDQQTIAKSILRQQNQTINDRRLRINYNNIRQVRLTAQLKESNYIDSFYKAS